MLLLSSADIFSKLTFKNHPGTLSDCQTVWIQIRTDNLNCFQRLSAEDTILGWHAKSYTIYITGKHHYVTLVTFNIGHHKYLDTLNSFCHICFKRAKVISKVSR